MLIQSILTRKSKNTQWKVLVQCPKCGKWGTLNRSGYKNAFHVVHTGRAYCRHGWTHPAHEKLKTILNDNRKKGGIIDNIPRAPVADNYIR